ncbi:MAG: hypothetical protein WA418_34035 [Bradyrhizobium sp.]
MMKILMTALAAGRRVPVGLRTVTLLTGDGFVEPDQGEACDLVVKGHVLAPSRIIVASLAALPELTLMRILLAVARHAGRRQFVAIEIARVARIALGLRMGVAQRKLRLIVVEVGRLPLDLIVAGLALVAVPASMHVLQLVARATAARQVLVLLSRVTGRAGHRLVRADQGKLRLAVVEFPGVGPFHRRVTVLTALAEPTAMRIDLLVTVEAARRRITIFHLGHMASGAWHTLVSIDETIIRHIVLERFLVEGIYIGLTSLVVSMALSAFLARCGGVAPVQARAGRSIGGHFLVTIDTQAGLSAARERLVAFAALRLVLRVALRQRTRHHQLFQDRLGLG